MKWKAALPIAVASLGLATMAFGARRWRSGAEDMRRRLDATRLPPAVATYHVEELASLPAPVQRYLGAVLRPGQAVIAAATFEQAGTFDMSEAGCRWMRFVATQRVIAKRPGFDWNARIAMFPGAVVRVHDAYVAGEGILRASLFGLLPLADLRGTPEMARGELMRFLAEAPCYPTALLPSQGVTWDSKDASSANATLHDGDTTVTLLFHFGHDGLVDTVRADARGRTVAGKIDDVPWEGTWRRYAARDGMWIPHEGEAAWILPAGRKPYWRGRMTRATYEFAE